MLTKYFSKYLSKWNKFAKTVRATVKSIPGFPFFYKRKAFKLRNLSNGAIPNFSPFVYDLQAILKGKLITLNGQVLPISPVQQFWKNTFADKSTLQEMHSFFWLSFFNKIGDFSCMKTARLITEQWIKANKDARSPAWEPKTTAIRLVNWAQNYRFMISSSDNSDKSSVHRSFARQLSYLIGEEKYLLDSDDLVCVIYAVIRLVPRQYRVKLANKYVKHLGMCSILKPEHLDSLPPDSLVENLQYLSNIKLLMQIWEIKNLDCLDKAITCCQQLLNNMIHANGALATFNSKTPYPNEFIKTLCLNKIASTQLEAMPPSRIIKVTSEPSSILIDTGDFIATETEMFCPINFEYSCDHQVLISGAGICIENKSFRIQDKAPKGGASAPMFKSEPVAHEMYEENKNTWFDGSTRWLFMGETFAITRQIYLCRGGQELRCEDRVSHAYGFATFLIFSIPASLKLTKLKEVNGLVIEEILPQGKNQKWAWYFSKETKFQICNGQKHPINGIMQAVKHLVVPCSRDYDHTVSRWSLRRL